MRRRVEAFNQDKENCVMMNKEIFEANWELIRGQITAKWSLIVEYDLKKVDKAEVKYEKMNTMLRVKYGLTHLKAREEIGKLWAEYESKNRVKV
jgi:hypothetical protein